jgi:hypothetical protein
VAQAGLWLFQLDRAQVVPVDLWLLRQAHQEQTIFLAVMCLCEQALLPGKVQ